MKVTIYNGQDMANFIDILVRNGYICKVNGELYSTPEKDNNLVYLVEVLESQPVHQLLTEDNHE